MAREVDEDGGFGNRGLGKGFESCADVDSGGLLAGEDLDFGRWVAAAGRIGEDGSDGLHVTSSGEQISEAGGVYSPTPTRRA